MNVFGCELSPNIAVSDKYCMAHGGSAQPDSSLPSAKSIEDATNRENDAPREAPQETPFASPPTSQPDIDLDPGNQMRMFLGHWIYHDKYKI